MFYEQCMRKRCRAIATHSVKFVIPARPPQDRRIKPMELFCHLQLCQAHACKVVPSDITSDSISDLAIHFMQIHEAEADFVNSAVFPISLNDPHYLLYQKTTETIH